MPLIPQSLFEMVTVNGVEMTLAFVGDHECTVLRDGAVVETLPSDGDKLNLALRRYFKLVGLEGGTRQPVRAIDLPRDPRRPGAPTGGPTRSRAEKLDARRSLLTPARAPH